MLCFMLCPIISYYVVLYCVVLHFVAPQSLHRMPSYSITTVFTHYTALYLSDHRFTVSVRCAGWNLFLCYPDEMESMAIVCLENFTVSALGWSVLCCTAILWCVVCCSVQCSVLYDEGFVDVFEVVDTYLMLWRWHPIPSHITPSSSTPLFHYGTGGVRYPCGGAGDERHYGRGATSSLRQVLQSRLRYAMRDLERDSRSNSDDDSQIVMMTAK